MIACISVPYFAASVEHRDGFPGKEGNGHPPGLVLGGQPWEPGPLFAYSREAARNGVRPGMSLRLAHVISPEAAFIGAHPPRYFDVSGEITDILTDFTHLIEPEALWHPDMQPKGKSTAASLRLPARFNLDLEKLPEKEAVFLAKEIGKEIRQQTWMNPAIGIAENKFVAQIASRLTQPNHARSISPSETARFLSSRSIHFLPLDKETSRRLSLLGIRTLGQLTALPLTSLQAQLAVQNRTGFHHSLGHEFSTLYSLVKGGGQPRLNTANGNGNPLLSVQPIEKDKSIRLEFTFDIPVANMETIKRVLARMAVELAGRLQEQNSSCQSFHLSIGMDCKSAEGKVEGKESCRSPVSKPEDITRILVDLFRGIWSKNESPNLENPASTEFFNLSAAQPLLGDYQGVISLKITASAVASTKTNQLSLFEPVEAASKGANIIRNLAAKHGGNWFFKAELQKEIHPLPEQRFQIIEFPV